MPEAFAEALAFDGLLWLIAGTVVAGFVRGFSGFGTALIFMPVAGQLMPPLWALTVLVVMDVFGPIPNLPRARRDGNLGEVALLTLAMILALPLGLMVLASIQPEVFRYAVSLLAILVPILLLAGLRYRRPLTPPILLGTGAISGFLGGVVGVPGPPVILLYLASTRMAAQVRANILIYLFAFDIVLIALLAVQDRLYAVPVILGLILALPVMLANMAGAAIFRPEKERLYRAAAYVIIAAAAISGLPLWD
ncbi:sulfite exporter TauE/SafE family protein [Seohaeicola sp. SP36]|uniref:sulfite exporter TauE/SafE family protein n=1 Tax=unclassified Seohaeicola TaxID=2641111 RepID=UPI00237C0828|nr:MULTISPECIES: sulfite exporter TauE/SafE family protein [unclassified Seohaeicola]MDD9706237.1 sulfite exporter TauE/SafE family protein [Seohaeicola sp. 4SK31]MDD9734696.1 sulfite exporter TauE/SafE family protein [Seohaeicola sp. SP36]